jgi:hypothetical protein
MTIVIFYYTIKYFLKWITKRTYTMRTLFIFLIFCALLLIQKAAIAQNDNSSNKPSKESDGKTVPVTWETFVRAETDRTFNTYFKLGAFGKFFHLRAVTPIDKQDVVRMNRDTRYSIGIFDLNNPLTVTLPDATGRYIAMQVINQDEYTKSVEYDAKSYTFTKESIGSRYVGLIIRILVNGEDEKDNQIVTEIQNKIAATQSSIGTFEIPNWDQPSLDKLRDAFKVIASTLTDTKLCFGDVDEVDPIAHLLGAAAGWGGNPPHAALYINALPEKNDGKTAYTLTVNDVPVDGFWSISVYNSSGFFEKNRYNAYSVNNFSAKKEKDGSYIIHFGGDPKQTNYLPLTEGWNYMVRLYRAKEQILNGSWVFPSPVQVN